MNDLTPIARIGAAPQAASSPDPGPRLTRRQKAAIVVKFLLNEGADVPLTDLPEELQADLTQQLGAMRAIDRTTLAQVIAEFARDLEQIGLSFPRGLLGALEQLDGRISPQTVARLRREAGVRHLGDPWARIRALPVEDLHVIFDREATEVAAVVLSKLDTARAAELLGRLPGDRARILTYAMSQTANISPDAVDRIGLSLASQLDDVPPRAFDDSPSRRVGAILNMSSASTRDQLLDALAQEDAGFAEDVRKAIFTFPDIPARLAPNDIARVTREVDQGQLVIALRYAMDLGGGDAAAADFILTGMSKRMADGLREEMADMGAVKTKPGEEAQNALIGALRRLEAAGEITLITPEPEEG